MTDTMNSFTAPRIMGAYLRMARDARYRPAAPSDGHGNIQLSDEEMEDADRLLREAKDYGERFQKEEDTCQFFIGMSGGTTVAASIFVLEAARLLCGGMPKKHIIKLLEMAIAEINTPTDYPEEWDKSRVVLDTLVEEYINKLQYRGPVVD